MNFNLKKCLSLLFITVVLTACDDGSSEDDNLGNWVQAGYFDGQPRSGAVQFVIDNIAYVGLGYDGDDYFTDFYGYDVDRGLWIDIAPFPGDARERAVAFAINGKAYVGLGYNRDLDVEEMKDFWEYNPLTNTWSSIADFKGTARYNAVGFAIGETGYVGTGYDGDYYRSDFFSYNPETDAWVEIASFPGGKREEALTIVYNNKAYFATGRNNGVYTSDIWIFDPIQESWDEVTPDDDEDYYDDFNAAVRRYSAVGFVLNDKLYIATGITSTGAASSSVYEYNPANGEWDEKTSFEGSERTLANAFVIANRGFIGLGQNNSRRWDDVWEFFPDAEYDDAD
jgi:N-acetylneuraminic acid mutarotase